MTRYTRGHAVSLAWGVEGSGPPLLLIHDGFLSFEDMSEETRFARCTQRLASFTTLIRFDRRGVGLSDPPPPDATLVIDDWVDDVVAVLDAAGVEGAWLMGSVEMAGLAVRVAAEHPDRVLGLVLVNASARALEAPDYPIGFPSDVADALIEATLDAEGGGELLRLTAPSACDDPAFLRWWDRAGRRGASPSVARRLLELVVRSDVRADLPRVRARTLVLHRKGDQVLPIEHGRFVAENIPDAVFVELEGEDDLWWVGDSDALLDQVEEFVTGMVPDLRDERIEQAVLFTDIVGSTTLLSTLGDRTWARVLDSHEVLVRRSLAQCHGREVQFTGDGVLAVFDDVDKAVTCARRMMRGASDLNLRLRAGLHVGPVARRVTGVSGLVVHVAARVAALAEADELLVTAAVANRLDDRWPLSPHPEQRLRGVDGTWPLFAIEERG